MTLREQISELLDEIRNRANDAPMPTEHLLDDAACVLEDAQAKIKTLQDEVDQLLSERAATAALLHAETTNRKEPG